MNFKLFLSVLSMYRHNFKMIHWNAEGKHFDLIHELSDKYSKMVDGDVDAIAEIMKMVDVAPVSYLDSVKELEKQEDSFIHLDSDVFFDYDDSVKYTDSMLSSIKKCIEQILESDDLANIETVGIRSELESMQFRYSKEVNFFNKKRKD